MKKLDITLRNAKSFLIFRNSSLKIGRPIPNSIFKIHDPLGIKFLTRLTLGLSHLNEHRFRHNFQDCLNTLCSCSLEVESITHFFLLCHQFNQFRQTLLDSVTLLCLIVGRIKLQIFREKILKFIYYYYYYYYNKRMT